MSNLRIVHRIISVILGTCCHRCDPFDAVGFKAWAAKGQCPAIPPVLGLFNKLIRNGFKVILLTGRDEETLKQCTVDNLRNQGFIGYDRLIMR